MTWNDRDMERMVAKYRKDRVDLDAGVKTKKAQAAKLPVEDLKGISGSDLLGKLGL